jgi:hypothetical protein
MAEPHTSIWNGGTGEVRCDFTFPTADTVEAAIANSSDRRALVNVRVAYDLENKRRESACTTHVDAGARKTVMLSIPDGARIVSSFMWAER